jgi:beta-lactamase regulating signal transducer with metallopeptidase domain
MAMWLLVKAAFVLGGTAASMSLVGRRMSAATRHLVWVVALSTVLLVPLCSAIVPAWTLTFHTRAATPALPLSPAATTRTVTVEPVTAALNRPDNSPMVSPVPSTQVPGPGVGGREVFGFIYVLGLSAMLVYVAVQHWTVRRLASRARLVSDARWTSLFDEAKRAMGVGEGVRLLRSPEVGMPVAIGVRHPAVVLPAVADTWTEDRRRAVLLHELAHVSRRDCLTQAVACIARAIYWVNPLTWWAERQLRTERELACDDRVLDAGTGAREYAGHLLEIAYALGRRRAPALAVAMARPGQLEGRMLAALDDRRPRSRPTLRFRLGSMALTAVLLGPISAASPLFVEHDSTSVAPRDGESASPGTRTQATQPPALKPAPWAGHVGHLLGPMGAVGAAAERGQGTWEIRPGHAPGTVRLRIAENHSSSETEVPASQLEGLSAAQLAGAGGPVHFRVRRDAGTFTFDGMLKSGVGAGTFAFEADPRFASELAARGVGRPTPDQQYRLARADAGYALLDALKAQGYGTPRVEDLVTAADHGVSAEYVSEMGRLGYRLGTLQPLITLRDHGVTPEYVSALAALGYKGLSADEATTARDHGVTPEYVGALQGAGYARVPMADLVNVRDHGVTPEYIRELTDAGYRGITLEQLVRVRDHGVTGEYVRGMKALGFALTLDELVQARDHGVTVEYAQAMRGLGYTQAPVDTLITLRDHGVTAEYATAVRALGYEGLSPDDLVRLRDHGLTANRISKVNSRAGSRLPVAELVTRASHGIE